MKDMALTQMGMSILLIKYFYAHANLDLCNHIKLLCTWLILLFNLKLHLLSYVKISECSLFVDFYTWFGELFSEWDYSSSF